jgi:hypothetical protein
MVQGCVQVRVRSVGVGGAGHSAWSEVAQAVLPGRHEEPASPSSCAEEAEAAAAAAQQPKKRRSRRPAAERELALADSKISVPLRAQNACHHGDGMSPVTSLPHPVACILAAVKSICAAGG